MYIDVRFFIKAFGLARLRIDISRHVFIIALYAYQDVVRCIDFSEKQKGGKMRFVMALIVMFSISFIACDQGQVAGIPDFTGPAKGFVEMLAKGDYANVFATFDAAMKDAMPEDAVSAAWESLLAQVGDFKRISGVRQVKEQGYDVVYVTCGFEKSQLDVKVVFNDKKEVSGLWFEPK